MRMAVGRLLLFILVLAAAGWGSACAQGVIDLASWWGSASFRGEGLDRAGASLATGDFDGDGTWDIAIGSPGTQGNAGAVYLFLGSVSLLDSTLFNDLPAQANLIIQSEDENQIGISLQMGDVNGDGLEDLLIGAPHAVNGTGNVWIVFGRANPSGSVTTPDVLIQGAAAGDGCGTSVGTSFVDGDAIQDLIVGSPGADPYQRDSAGRVDVILGRFAAWPDTIDLASDPVHATLFGAVTGARTGQAVARALSFDGTLLGNDINGDNAGDVAFGAPGQNYTGRTASGMVHLFVSGESVTDTVDLANAGGLLNYKQLGGANLYNGLGRSLASYTNGQRRGLLIGSPNASYLNFRPGAVYDIAWSQISAPGIPVDLGNPAYYRLRYVTGNAADSLGSNILAGGGLWMISASGGGAFGRTQAGFVYQITQAPEQTGTVRLDTLTSGVGALAGENPGDRLGRSLAIADFDGDGLFDGGTGSPFAGSYAGRAYLVRGGLPYAFFFQPGPGAAGVPTSTSLTFSARDDQEGLSPDATSISINGTSYPANDPAVSYTSSDGLYEFTVQPPQSFPIDVPIPVIVQVEDDAANRSPVYSYQFVTGRDDRAPEVVRLSPRPGEIDVATTRNVEFGLVDPGAGVDTTSIRVTVQGTTYSWGDPRISSTGDIHDLQVVYNPSGDFPADARIDVTLNAADLVAPTPNVMTPYSYYFFTTADTIPPNINGIFPPPGATIDVTTLLHVWVFDNSAGVDPASTQMLLTQGGNTIPAELTFVPTAGGYDIQHRPGDTPYDLGQMIVTFRSTDLAEPANPMPDSVWTYTVIRDSIPPRMVSANPAPNSTGAARNTAIRFVLGDNAAGIDTSTVQLSVDGNAISLGQLQWRRLSYLQYEITYNHTGAPYGNSVTVDLAASDHAVPANSFDTTYTFQTTQDTTAPVIVYLSPLPGEGAVPVNDTLVWEARDNLSGVNPSSAFLSIDGVDHRSDLTYSQDVTQPGAEYRFIYDPQQNFPYEDSVHVFFSIGDRETPSNVLTRQYAFFTEPDETPPYLADRSPYPGQTGVSRNANVIFTVLDRGVGVELDSLKLLVNNQLASTEDLFIQPVDSGYAVRYNPPGLFAHLDTVHVRVIDYDKALIPNRMDEQYEFVTLSDDREPPYIANLIPADSTTDWPVDAGVQFDLLDAGTGVDSAFTRIQRVGAPLWVANDTITAISDGFHYSLSPVTPFLYSDTVTIEVQARDKAEPHNEMVPPFQFTFYTERDDTPPTITNLVPQPDSGITINRYMEFTLADNLAGVDTASVRFTLNGEDALAGATVTHEADTWRYRYRPTDFWNVGDTIQVHVQVNDLSAGLNPASRDWAFTIVPDTVAPFVPADSLYPVPGATGIALNDTLRLLLLDDGVGVDPNLLELTVAGTQAGGLANADSVEFGYEFSLPLDRLDLFAGQTVQVDVTAWDIATPPNRMGTYRYSFSIQPPDKDFSVVPSTITPNGDGVWDDALIYHSGSPSTQVAIFDMRGRKVATVSGMPARWSGRDDQGNPLPGGLYILQVKVGGKVRQTTIAVAR